MKITVLLAEPFFILEFNKSVTIAEEMKAIVPRKSILGSEELFKVSGEGELLDLHFNLRREPQDSRLAWILTFAKNMRLHQISSSIITKINNVIERRSLFL